MDVAGMAATAVATQQAQAGLDLAMAMVKQAVQQEAALVQLVAAAAQAAPKPGNGQTLDLSV